MENHNHHIQNHKEHKEPFDKHEGHTASMFIKRFWVSLILTIPVVIYSELPRKLIGWQARQFSGSKYLLFILGSFIFFYGGWIFIKGAIKELKAKLPGMMTLISLAISVAYLYSVFAVLTGKGHDLFWELATLITIMLFGHWLEMKAVFGAQGALKELVKLLPDTAEVIKGDKTEILLLAELQINDIVFTRPGGKIPADGVVIEGKSEVNESTITGESKPVSKSVGDNVIAGTINGNGSLKIKITKIGENTFLSGIMRLVAEAQSSKSKLQILSDRAAFYLTIIAIISGILTFASWIFLKSGATFAFERLVAVLVIACPHALGLAVPLVVSISTTLAARNGFLVRQRIALESARNVDVVLFDKTGTLTKGEYGVDKILTNGRPRIVDSPAGGSLRGTLPTTDDQLLQLAASVDSHSEHFVAKAIVKEAKKRGLILSDIKDFQRIAGKGTRAKVNDSDVWVGGEAILKEADVLIPEMFKLEIDRLAGEGKTIIFAVSDKNLIGIIALADLIRQESREAINGLKKMGVKSAMLTGDSEETAKWVSEELGIEEYFFGVLPGEKAEIIRRLQNLKQPWSFGFKFLDLFTPFRNQRFLTGFRNSDLEIRNSRQRRVVAMVGDGINDAPALAQADIGIAIGAGTNVAIESAGIILAKNDPRDIVSIIKLSRLTYNKMIQNLFWATGYNIVALPLAAGVLASYGILLQPALAAAFMSLSTVIVAINAILMKRYNIKGSMVDSSK